MTPYVSITALLAMAATSAAFTPSSPRFTTTTSMPLSTSNLKMSNTETLEQSSTTTRRKILSTTTSLLITSLGLPSHPLPSHAASAAIQDQLNIDEYLRTGMDPGGPMGVSSQAGKSRPQTGVVFRDGSDVSRDSRTGSVLAEILVGTKAAPTAVLTTFASPWPLQTGPVFDVECRDGKTGDGAFLAVTTNTGGKTIGDLERDFLLGRLFDPTGRFSFYGPPTDIKVKSDDVRGGMRYIELKFSNLSQSTGAEIPRNAIVAATIPEGTENAVMLVGSSNAARWRKGSEADVRRTVESFQAVPAPKSSLKLRAKQRGGEEIL